MNKMVKGALAGTTGIALLMGGFGTYATWTDSQTVNSGRLVSGELDIVSAAPGTWSDVSVGATSSTWNVATDKMVPGDKIKLTQPLDVTAVGKNLKVDLTVSGVTSNFAADNFKVSVSYAGKTMAFPGGPYTMVYSGPTELAALTAATSAEVTFELGKDAVANEAKYVDLSNAKITVTQIR